MKEKELAQQLLDFISASPSCYHVIRNISKMLRAKGFQELREEKEWDIREGECYYVTRGSSSLLAFRVPKGAESFQLIASHSDSPTFKIKENPEISKNGCTVLNVERYGGMICSTWMDRPLSVAGRILAEREGSICEKLVDVDRDLLLIPNLAIHMDRNVNSNASYNVQTDMLPVFGAASEPGALRRLIAEEAEVKAESILGEDLYLYNRMKGTIWGERQEYLSGPRLDDLQCAYASLAGFLAAENPVNIPVYCVFNNEEVGSQTRQGAASGFLKDTLERISEALGKTASEHRRMLAGSFMISADNAHAVHPNHADKADPTNRPRINGGIVLKHNANQKYTTDGVSAAVTRLLCRKADVPVQTFTNRSDMEGGSTLGNISGTQVAVETVDVGLPQWAMHSAYETAGVKDTAYLERLAEVFYRSRIGIREDGSRFIGE